MMFWFMTIGCGANLDFMIHNGKHCSLIDDFLCTEKDYWDQLCTPCEEELPWDKEYEWMESTISNGETIRGIDPATVIDLDFDTEDGAGTLDAYFIPAHGENAELAETTLLYSHGNYGGIEHYVPRLQMLHEWGVNILVWDYRGYGKSSIETHPTQDQFLADARQAIDVLLASAPNPDKVFLYANSVGGIPAVEQAIHAQDSICALFMEAAWTSMRQTTIAVSTNNLPGGYLSEGKFENDIKIKSYNGPVFYLHGSLDNRFPIEHVEENFNNAPGPKDLWVLDGIYHGIENGGVPEAGLTQYYEHMTAFLREKAPACLTSTSE